MIFHSKLLVHQRLNPEALPTQVQAAQRIQAAQRGCQARQVYAAQARRFLRIFGGCFVFFFGMMLLIVAWFQDDDVLCFQC